MTGEEIEMLAIVRESDVIDKTDGSELAKAFNHLWEKYVEQEPCEDAISRQAVLDMMQMKMGGKELYKAVYDMPPVNPQPKTDTLDKIRSEIDRQQKWLLQAGYTTYNVDIALDAIKAVMTESEDKE